jgi:hypothetical protein
LGLIPRAVAALAAYLRDAGDRNAGEPASCPLLGIARETRKKRNSRINSISTEVGQNYNSDNLLE